MTDNIRFRLSHNLAYSTNVKNIPWQTLLDQAPVLALYMPAAQADGEEDPTGQ